MPVPSPPAGRPVIACASLTKLFGATRAVDQIDLEVREGELLALLGPSGCGKTTFLRLVAGFERPDAGRITLDGAEVASPRHHVPPEQRNVGVVFQDYALFPHLSVASNVGYGVRDRSRRSERVAATLALVGLAGLGDRHPHELSGGQQQRVALARVLAPEPATVLLDEPFSNLDAALRSQVRDEVRAILRRAGATAVIVTHDQEEALSMADRVAVMRRGRVLQVDTPAGLYARPADPFVAAFVGDADLLPGTGGGDRVHTPIGAVRSAEPVDGGPVLVMFRPETVRLRLDGSSRAVILSRTFYGHDQVFEVALPDGATVRARVAPDVTLEPGDRVKVSVTEPVATFRPDEEFS